MIIEEKTPKQVREQDEKVTKTDEEVISDKMITVYGGVELTKAERRFLSLGPLFPLMEDLQEETMSQDFLTGLTKLRWGRMGKDLEEILIYREIYP